MKFVLFAALTRIAMAQIAGPALGLVADGGTIRTMYGLPAAGAVGGVIASGLSNIAISPQQNFALATDQNGAAVLVLSSGAMSPVAGTAANAARIAISPSGSAAALWFSADRHFEVLTGMPTPANIQEIDATAFGAPLAFAVSDDGHLAASFDGGVELFGTDGSVAPLGVNERITALAFFPQSANIALASPGRVLSFVNGSATSLYDAARTVPASPRLTETAGIAASSDNRWIVRAARGGSVVAINLANGTASESDCGCSPDGVFPIGGTVFRLTNRSVRLFDATSGNFYDVPAAGGQQ